jgi:hypothetical protein
MRLAENLIYFAKLAWTGICRENRFHHYLNAVL